jgi:hypothetical protein
MSMTEQDQDRGSRSKSDEATAQAIKALAQRHVEKAIDTLVDVMEGGERDGLRLAAARQLLDLAVDKTRRSKGNSAEDDNAGVDEILRRSWERARSLRPRNGEPSGGASP